MVQTSTTMLATTGTMLMTSATAAHTTTRQVTTVVTSTTSTTTNTAVAIVTKIAGTMEVEIVLQGTLEQEAVEAMFKKAIAGALGISMENVVELQVTQVQKGAGLRRLESLQTHVYEVTYEVLLPESMDPDTLAEKANRIAAPDSAESFMFKQALKSTSGVEEIGLIVSKVPAYKFQDQATTAIPSLQLSHEEETSPVPFVIGGVAGFAAVLVFVATIIYKRSGGTDHMKAALRNGRWLACEAETVGHDVIPRVRSSTLLDRPSVKSACPEKEFLSLA